MVKLSRFIMSIILLFSFLPLFTLEVDRKEVETGTSEDSIQFINYTGPHTVINSIQEIEGIGTSLGASLLQNSSGGDKQKYSIIHAVDSAVKTGFDGDILILGPQAGVDHIDNLRRIIASYISNAYGYSMKDSATLAKFITVYNAVYRGKLDVFKARYKPIVLGYLTSDKVGLSVRYDEWPGRTQLVIPLSEVRLAGTISTIDTTALTDKAIVEKIKEDPKTASETRKDMVDLKERESDAAQIRAETAQKDAAAARTETAQKKEELATAQKEAQKASEEADKLQTPEAIKTAEEKKATAEQKKDDVATAEEKVTQKEETAKADQTLADTKQKETQAERKEIASDTQKELNEKTTESKNASEKALASANPGYALKVVDSGNLLSELVLVNLNDGKIIKASSLNTIRERTLYDTGSGLIAIAGKKGGNGAIKLVLIDPLTLEILKQGTDNIAETSMLVQNANDYYAVIESAGSFILGRFDKNLEVKAKSAIKVQAFTPITVTAKGILVQDNTGTVKLLRSTDLVE